MLLVPLPFEVLPFGVYDRGVGPDLLLIRLMPLSRSRCHLEGASTIFSCKKDCKCARVKEESVSPSICHRETHFAPFARATSVLSVEAV